MGALSRFGKHFPRMGEKIVFSFWESVSQNGWLSELVYALLCASKPPAPYTAHLNRSRCIRAYSALKSHDKELPPIALQAGRVSDLSDDQNTDKENRIWHLLSPSIAIYLIIRRRGTRASAFLFALFDPTEVGLPRPAVASWGLVARGLTQLPRDHPKQAGVLPAKYSSALSGGEKRW